MNGKTGPRRLSRRPSGRRRWLRRCLWAGLGSSGLAALGFTVAWFAFPFPVDELDCLPVSARLVDRHGRLLAERVDRRDQWRRPLSLDDMGPWLALAVIAVEDERFRDHPGVDLLAVVRAVGQNVASGRVVSGASTITMQVCKLLEPRPRTLTTKVIESFRALQLESLRSKDEILEAWLNLAPFGGNLQGVEVAAGRYFGRRARDLSLSEAALLVGLPQSPERLRPDRFPQRARARRGTVLRRMAELGFITQPQRHRALREPIRLVERRRVDGAPHFVATALARRPAGGTSTLDLDVQSAIGALVADHRPQLPAGTDVAVVVVNIVSGDVVALVGSADVDDPVDGQVNGAFAWRSPGSALKPFIYAAAFAARSLAPESTVWDVPIERGGWRPRNFGGGYDGELTARDALVASRNVPAILVAEALGVARCRGTMAAAGIVFRERAPTTGLTLATGGAEVRLVDLVNAYACLGRGGEYQPLRWFVDDPWAAPVRALDRDTCAAIDDVLGSHRRVPAGMELLAPESVPFFVWKTGTSSGHRDAWAVGHDRRHAIGVWVGRFSGSGDPRLVARDVAEPLLARCFAVPELDPRPSLPLPVLPAAWQVRAPLPAPPEASGDLVIVTPRDGTVYRALGDKVRLRPEARGARRLQWFVNGRRVPEGTLASRGVEVRRGTHELRCIGPRGRAARVTVLVR